MTIDLRDFQQGFYEESLEGLDIMEKGLLQLPLGCQDSDVIDTLFRVAHSIKGGSGMFGITPISSFTHILESLLDGIRSGAMRVSQEVVQLLLETVDCLRTNITAMQQGHVHESDRMEALKIKMGAILVEGGSDLASRPKADQDESDLLERTFSPVSYSGWRIRFHPHPEILRAGYDPILLFRELASKGRLTVTVDCSRLPAFHELDPEECFLDWDLVLQGKSPRAQIKAVFERVAQDSEVVIDAIGQIMDCAPPKSSSANTKVNATESDIGPITVTDMAETCVAPDRRSGPERRRSWGSMADSTSIRVGIDKIDALINLVGELAITQSILGECGKDLTLDNLDNLRTGLTQLARNSRALQEAVLRIRMLPISNTFNHYPRLVHDLGNKLGKKVELKISGEQTELDKTVMEKIGDPLVHLVRNALDHGIEAPEVRTANGKPAVGVLHLNAYHQGSSIVIEVSDDGAGLDTERIKTIAQERGLLMRENGPWPDERIQGLIFEPGFSTVDQVSDVSGRGVGMDVVRRNVKALGGTVEVRSKVGAGSTFTIRLPLTLAILEGQLVRVGRHIYVVPLVSIVELVQIDGRRVLRVARKLDLYRLRDSYLPIIPLYRLFNVRPDEGHVGNGLLLVVEGDGRKAGLYVDEFLAQQQVVIKSLETNYRRIEGLSGATILADGRVAPIIDVHGVMTLARNQLPPISAVEFRRTSAV